MGIRVRKLARELRQTPRDVLQLLKSLGFERYQSPDDMISDTVAARVRSKAPSLGVHRAADPALAARARTPSPAPATGDLMAQLVPGVTRTRSDQRTSGSLRSAEEGALQRQRADQARIEAALKAEREALDAAREALDAERAALVEETARVQALGRELDERQASLTVEAEALTAARATFVAEARIRAAVAAPPTLMELFRERGVSGTDEAERALAALAGGHALGHLVKEFTVGDAEAFRRVLADRLVLVGGPVPDGLGIPGVSVAPERAELAGAPALDRAGARLSEQWMLFGFRAVTLVGVPPRWHSLVRSLVDARVSLSFVPPHSPLPERVGSSEAWFVWGTTPDDQTRPDRVHYIVSDGDLVRWFERVTRELADRPA